MHSSRMHTVRSSGYLGGGGGGVYPRGLSAWRVYPNMQWDRHTPLHPRTEFLTHASENITFPQPLLQTVATSEVTLGERPINI